MANKIEYTDIGTNIFVTRSSRYLNSIVIYYGDNKSITFTTYKKNSYIPGINDQVAVIPSGMEYRPDLVSKQKYGTVDFWWKIMEVNGIKDVFEFKAGKTIVLPENIYA